MRAHVHSGGHLECAPLFGGDAAAATERIVLTRVIETLPIVRDATRRLKWRPVTRSGCEKSTTAQRTNRWTRSSPRRRVDRSLERTGIQACRTALQQREVATAPRGLCAQCCTEKLREVPQSRAALPAFTSDHHQQTQSLTTDMHIMSIPVLISNAQR